MHIITKDLLLNQNWKLDIDELSFKLSDDEKKVMDSQGIKYNWEDYTLIVYNKDHDNYKGYWFLTMRYDLSNTPNRDWSIHIDNNLHESVANVDIGTVEQFNKLMDLMDIEYRLTIIA